MLDLKDNMRIHFIGIGGAGMLPLALHSQVMGHKVTGSDMSEENFPILNKEGIFPDKGHSIVEKDVDLVVFSSAVKDDNFEMVSAKEQNIPAVKRAEFLGLITKQSHAILVSGCHGKSTTSTMLADMLNNDEKYFATALVGAETVSRNSNYYKGGSDYIILEADEYDRSFLKMYPSDLIILNIDDDHLDIYGDIEGLKNAFRELIGKLNKNSILVYNGDDEKTCDTVKDAVSKNVSFGIINKCVYNAVNIEFENFHTKFDLIKNENLITKIEYFYSGNHNVCNMLSAAALLCEYGISGDKISELAKNFKGVKRRQEIIYQDKDYILMDDYGHHPSEVKSSLENIRINHKGRIIVLFQPHLYSRTKYHSKGFAESFSNADLVMISHIYPAREKFDPTTSSKNIYMDMNETEMKKTSVFDNFEDLYVRLKNTILPGDLIISMGAGEINKVLYKLKLELKTIENS